MSRSVRESFNQGSSKILINVYDLLPLKPGAFASTLWFFGSSLLHSGIVIQDREYAYGCHDRQGISGVYWIKPRLEPPGGTFRRVLHQGYTSRSVEDVNTIVKEVSMEFLGTCYNVLTNNCNHFTAYLCYRLTRNSPPPWLNRAASIGIALTCLVPKDWVSPPDRNTADGELLVEEDEDDENSAMLRHDKGIGCQNQLEVDDLYPKSGRRNGDSREDTVPTHDTDGRALPASE